MGITSSWRLLSERLLAVSGRVLYPTFRYSMKETAGVHFIYRGQHSLNTKMENARLREHASDIFNVGVKAVFPQAMMLNALKLDGNVLMVADRRYIVNRNIHVVAFGKAVIGMVRTAEDILKNHIVGGIASIPYGMQDVLKSLGKWDLLPGATSRVKIIEGAARNMPDENANRAAMDIYNLLTSLGKDDIVLALISGGGSALLPAPIPPVTLSELLEVTSLLSQKGATIQQLNTVRKHLELLKAGGLAKAAFPAQVIALLISDVVENDLQFLSSGPTVPDFTTPQQCLDLLNSMGCIDQAPRSVLQVLEEKARLPEFKKEMVGHGENIDFEQIVQKNQPSFHCRNVQNLIIGSNVIAMDAGDHYAQSLGYAAFQLSHTIVGDATERGQMFALLANYVCRSLSCRRGSDKDLVDAELDLVRSGISKSKINELCYLLEASHSTRKPVCILAAGETVVDVKGKGLGGRNQQMALSAAAGMHSLMKDDVLHEFAVTFLSGGTDGEDGPTDAAGAIADPHLVRRATKNNLDIETYLENNDTYNFFSKVDMGRNLLKTGLTGTNVMDLQVLLISHCSPETSVTW